MLERIAAGRTDLVFDILSQGHPANGRTADGTALIQWCAYYGDVSAIRQLIAYGETLQSLGPDIGLNAAAFHGHWRLCEFLLENGAEANDGDSNSGETPLHSALSSRRPGRHQVVTVLLHAGADPNRPTRPGVETSAFMRDCRTKGETPLHRAAAFAEENTIELLLNAGASREARDANGDSPLSWASWYLRPDPILRMLCYDKFRIRPGRRSMEEYLIGEPHA